MAKKVLTDNLSVPLNGATTTRVDINNGDGNLLMDGFTHGEPVLVSGTLEYLANQGLPTRSVNTINGLTTLTLRASGHGQSWLHLPWSACNGATEWQIHLNPTVSFDITAHSGGGNLRLDLAALTVTHISVDTGGGNIEVVLPSSPANLSITAKTGAGNVVIEVPDGFSARIQATTGLGKVIVDPCFNKIDGKTYQSPDFNRAAHPVEMIVSSGAGNVVIQKRTVPVEVAAYRI